MLNPFAIAIVFGMAGLVTALPINYAENGTGLVPDNVWSNMETYTFLGGISLAPGTYDLSFNLAGTVWSTPTTTLLLASGPIGLLGFRSEFKKSQTKHHPQGGDEMKRLFRFLLVIALGFGMVFALISTHAKASLIVQADGTVLDDHLNIYWLANANLADSEDFGVAGINPNPTSALFLVGGGELGLFGGG